MPQDFDSFFRTLCGLTSGHAPHPWQVELAAQGECGNRQIRIPTGFGKTFGVLGAWLWHRLREPAGPWPRRLVWCLPMRVLVEQVQAEVQAALQRLGDPADRIGVYLLMGGSHTGDWALHPDRNAVLIGTQDMLLSRALNRGYGVARARWPIDFGLLNHDCLWVMDEVQLMDVGLPTSTQLQAFREQDADAGRALRPCHTWWMSATLQPSWLAIGPDAQAHLADLPRTAIPPTARTGPLWDADRVAKPLHVEALDDSRKIAALAARLHREHGNGRNGPTLVVLNRVDQAVKVYRCLKDDQRKGLPQTDLRLVHSRFRPAERSAWREAFLNRGACAPGTDRIIVATQVVEAGVDVSAALLLTEIAPWPSLVQRFGRSARWGGTAQVVVLDGQAKDDKTAAPYSCEAIEASRHALGHLRNVAPLHLEAFEDAHPELLPALYPCPSGQLLLRHELEELFDTAADLSGADTDISRFIRSGEERDLQVFWRRWSGAMPPAEPRIRPTREELCSVPFLAARRWLCPDDKPARAAWVWDWLETRWVRAEPRRLYPGQVVLVAASLGGYCPERGWAPDRPGPVPLLAHDAMTPSPNEPHALAAADLADLADGTEDDESLSIAPAWQTIAFHGHQVGLRAQSLAQALAPDLADLFHLAGRWHDAGKAHPAFQGCLLPHAPGADIAKAPSSAWRRGAALYRMAGEAPRHGFRHELASTLALLALMRRCQPDHAALLGPWRALLQQLPALAPELPASLPAEAAQPDLSPLEQEVVQLQAEQFDLLLYLVCSHHGKVRMSWHASPADQAANDNALRIRGVRAGDLLPALRLAGADGAAYALPASELVLAAAGVGLNPHTGRGWTERVLGLLQRHGPFTLAWLEALMRAADQQASADATLRDPSFLGDSADNPDHHGLEAGNQTVAGALRRGEAAPPLEQHPATGGGELRFRGRAGRLEPSGGRTRPPAHATHYLETQLGILSYQELAPHLALAARRVEAGIEAGQFDQHALDEQLIADLHQQLCGMLTPQLCGWRQQAVVVGQHQPPEAHRVPLLMRAYALELAARLEACLRSDEHMLEALAFAEGALLSIHPFADFNGRTTRLFLSLLLRRLDLPLVELVTSPDQAAPYFAALRAGDQRNWAPLSAVWRARLEASGNEPGER